MFLKLSGRDLWIRWITFAHILLKIKIVPLTSGCLLPTFRNLLGLDGLGSAVIGLDVFHHLRSEPLDVLILAVKIELRK